MTEILRRFEAVARYDTPPDTDAPVDISRTRFVASTDSLDRWGTRIVQDWMEDGRIEPYRANPVISLSHRWGGVSMGRGEDLEVGDVVPGVRGLFLTVAWDMDDDDAAALAGKYARGVMSAGSVGFRSEQEIALAALDKTHPWRADRGYMLQGNHLLEFAVGVLVPGNADALALRSLIEPAEQDWLRDALLRSAPEATRRHVAALLQDDPDIRRLLREVAGDMTTTAEHAVQVVRRNSDAIAELFGCRA